MGNALLILLAFYVLQTNNILFVLLCQRKNFAHIA